jgi:hypothetical protein
MLCSTWVRVRAPLMPEVALVELPPKKPEQQKSAFPRSCQNGPPRSVCDAKSARWFALLQLELTLLVENHDIAAGEVDGVSGRQTGNCKRRGN